MVNFFFLFVKKPSNTPGKTRNLCENIPGWHWGQRGHSLSSRADVIPRYQSTLERDARSTQPLLVFVSIKGKEEARKNGFLNPTSCGTVLLIQRGATGRAEVPKTHMDSTGSFSGKNKRLNKVLVAFSSLPSLSFLTSLLLSLTYCQSCSQRKSANFDLDKCTGTQNWCRWKLRKEVQMLHTNIVTAGKSPLRLKD